MLASYRTKLLLWKTWLFRRLCGHNWEKNLEKFKCCICEGLPKLAHCPFQW